MPDSKHTPGEWREGKTADSIVSDQPFYRPPAPSNESVRFYGGFVIAESVHP